MRIKVLQIGKFYVRLDLTVIHKNSSLLGFNYCEGIYSACTDMSFTDCETFDYCEIQLGFLLFNINIGKEQHRPQYEQSTEDNTGVQETVYSGEDGEETIDSDQR